MVVVEQLLTKETNYPIKNTTFMKTRIILFLAISAIITLSFSFISVKKEVKQVETSFKATSEPIGGFVAEDAI